MSLHQQHGANGPEPYVIDIKKENKFGGGSSDTGPACCASCCGIFVILLLLTTPITLLGFGYHFKNEMSCYTIINETHAPISSTSHVNLADTIGIFTWIQVHSGIGISKALVILFGAIIRVCCSNDNREVAKFCTYCIVGLLYVFHFVWAIVGGVMFWRDCYDLSPLPMNNIMWAVLIMGYFGI